MNHHLSLGERAAQSQTERTARNLMISLLVLAGVVATCGCTVSDTYVQADRATYDAIAPAHRAYVQQDAALSLEQRERRLTVLETWRKRLEAAEGPAARPGR